MLQKSNRSRPVLWWRDRRTDRRRSGIGGCGPMRLFRRLALGASVLALALGACSPGGGSASPGSSSPGSSNVTIKIGSDDFDEAKVVAEVYAQALEAAGFKVDRAGIGLGGRKITAPAIESGQIDLKPEYIGSGLTFY